MVSIGLDRSPVVASEEERSAAIAIERVLDRSDAHGFELVAPDGEHVNLSESVLRILRQAVRAMAEDHVVSIVPVHKQLTTQQAADLLGVSRPFLIRLLEEGQLPYSRTGTHRRIDFEKLMAYKKVRDVTRRQKLDELTRLSQEMGLYDID